ncbi:MAG: L-aspartate oxidase [Candidatus Bathyarchaeota archaeon]|nr:MAG: L-aspartate oxidase [Candidatus Bathyarchaeota archaeon]
MNHSNFLVVGSGLAGLSFALRAAELGEVTVITKKALMDSNSSLAQGGIAAVLGADDSFENHIDDTIRVGKGLCDRRAVELLVRRGPELIGWLMGLGVEFDRMGDVLDLGKEGGHSRRRVAHSGDLTGSAVQEVMVQRVKESPAIEIREKVVAVDLVVHEGSCRGIRALDVERSRLVNFQAPVTVLATGGVGQLYAKTSNPAVATGDGVAMAWWAGAELADMEFTQFHPTVLNVGTSPFFLISETVRGEGGILRNNSEEAFMKGIHRLGDLAPRDIVSRAMVEEQKRGQVYLDVRHKGEPFLRRRFPTIYQRCAEEGYSMVRDLIPVSPAAHYLCGGIKVNEYGETSIPGLLAFGECSCTGIHGANRMASNSMLECLVFTSLAFEKIRPHEGSVDLSPMEREVQIVDTPEAHVLRSHLQDVMWDSTGINRSVAGLKQVIVELREIEERAESLLSRGMNTDLIELHSMVAVARLITRAALTRRESRGTHYLADHPRRDDENWLKHIVFKGNRIKVEDHRT